MHLYSNQCGIETRGSAGHRGGSVFLYSNQCGIETNLLPVRSRHDGRTSTRTSVELKQKTASANGESSGALYSNQCGIETMPSRRLARRFKSLYSNQCGIETVSLKNMTPSLVTSTRTSVELKLKGVHGAAKGFDHPSTRTSVELKQGLHLSLSVFEDPPLLEPVWN